ncbi:hypothetical protein VZO05_11720 [Aggregatilineales bacterium SYSU G02658]
MMQRLLLCCALAWALAACRAVNQPIIPTEQPTATVTRTPTPTHTPAGDITPTPRPTQPIIAGQPSPTPLLGPSRTPAPDQFNTPTPRPLNPNAPRIEFFTSDPLSVQPGQPVTLFWSARGVDSAVIYQLDAEGRRTQVYNVAPDSRLTIQTRTSDRGALRFLLAIGLNETYSEATVEIPLLCPVEWFFNPPPATCPAAAPEETRIVDQTMERGRMLYVQSRNVIYVLFNDGRQPAWLSFENRYDPAIHPDRDPNAPPTFIQPLRELGYLWRTNDTVRNRLGLGLAEEVSFDGVIQTAPVRPGVQDVYVSGADGRIIHIVPGGQQWLLIGIR